MKIYPDRNKIDNFRIHLSKKELENLREGILAAPHPNSPWSKGVCNQISRALSDNSEYRSKSWE